MGKKSKVGKSRKDKFYRLAKETGYRARSAFKLIQLNKKYGFLNKSRVVIDLCAAPGGWMQVAAENCPVSSLIVGVDLVSIRSVKGCISIQEDITTDKCRQRLKQALQTWPADCVLNDGAPNVGKNWNHDAYNQSELTLHALKLATEFLRKGGWFVTKIFRSKDYFPLNWVFQQLFKKVWATKPQASRNESAEMFVVCEGFTKPTRIDPKFLDPKHVFQDVDAETKGPLLNLMHPEKKQRHREGYAEGDYTLFHVLKASDFIHSDEFMEKLATASMIELDEEVRLHKATSEEIEHCCQDIKVLGRKEIKALLSWRKAVLKDLQKAEKQRKEEEARRLAEEGNEDEEEESDHDEEEQELDEALSKAHEEDRLRTKRKKRKERKLLSKKRMRLDMKMDMPGDRLDYGDETGVFSLSKIRTKQALDEVQQGDLSFMDTDDIVADEDSADERDARSVLNKRQRLMESYQRDSRRHLDACEFPSDEEGEEEPTLDDLDDERDSDEDDEVDDDRNPLVVEMESKASRQTARTASWFSKGVFEGVEKEGDEVTEVQAMADSYLKQGGTVLDKPKKVSFAQPQKENNDNEDSSDDDDDDDDDDWGDDDSDDSDGEYEKISTPKSVSKGSKAAAKDDMEVVPVTQGHLKLDAVGLAMGTAMAFSKKRRRDIIESGYHRYMKGEGEDLPDWFISEEKKHCQKQMPVTKAEVDEHMMKMRAIDARPIKKLAEAKARKKKKMVRRLEKARKKAEAIGDTVDVSEREKMLQMKSIYKKAGLLGQKKVETTYVVAKKGIGRRVRRPQGVQGQFKVVDPRMKKDRRAEKSAAKKKGGGGRKGGKGGKQAKAGKSAGRARK